MKVQDLIPAGLLLLLSVRTEAAIIDSVSVEYGLSASHNCDLILNRIGLQRDWNRQWFTAGSTHVGGYWDLSFGYWNNKSVNKINKGIYDIALTPTFRLEGNQPSGLAPYLEAAVGFHVLTHAAVDRDRQFGSAFQFGDHLGFGARFGPRQAFDLSYRFQHLSNGGIRPPNKGINYNQLRFAVHFQP